MHPSQHQRATANRALHTTRPNIVLRQTGTRPRLARNRDGKAAPLARRRRRGGGEFDAATRGVEVVEREAVEVAESGVLAACCEGVGVASAACMEKGSLVSARFVKSVWDGVGLITWTEDRPCDAAAVEVFDLATG